MNTTLHVSGDLLTIRLSQATRQALGLQDDTPVTAEVIDGALVIRPLLRAGNSVGDPLAGVTDEAIGGAVDWSRVVEEEVRLFPTTATLLTQVTGLAGSQIEAVLDQGAEVPPNVSQGQIAANLAALLGLPWRKVLPVLGLNEAASIHLSSPSRELLTQISHVLELFAMVRAVLDAQDAAHWFTYPNRHLDGQRPLDLCCTPEGERRLRNHIHNLLSGNVA